VINQLGESGVIKFGRLYIKPLAPESKVLNGYSNPWIGIKITKRGLYLIENQGDFLPKPLDKEGLII